MGSRSIREGVSLRHADLTGADLRGADLIDANLRGADLLGANLEKASLWSTDLKNANLRNASLGSANLGDADLGDADLWGANLKDADLRGVGIYPKFDVVRKRIKWDSETCFANFRLLANTQMGYSTYGMLNRRAAIELTGTGGAIIWLGFFTCLGSTRRRS